MEKSVPPNFFAYVVRKIFFRWVVIIEGVIKMLLSEINGEYQKKRMIVYNADGTKRLFIISKLLRFSEISI